MFIEIWKREEDYFKLERRKRKREDCLTFNY